MHRRIDAHFLGQFGTIFVNRSSGKENLEKD
jgi:hypothetical protein